MPCEIWNSQEDLIIYPKQIDTTDLLHGTTLVIGDLHGNVIKFIYILIRYGLVRLDRGQADYDELLSICRISADTLAESDIERFFEILCAADYVNVLSLIILGDDLADRMYNDLLMLLLYSLLLDHCIHYQIILSNHGELGLRSIRAGYCIQEMVISGLNRNGTPYRISLQASLDYLWTLIDRQVVSLSTVRDLMDRVYKPFVCLIGYHPIQEGELILYTHAPVGILQMKEVMRAWHVRYDESSMAGMGRAIDQLNSKYRASIQLNVPALGPLDLSAELRIKALTPLLWQRELPEDFTLTLQDETWSLSLMHGHMGATPDWKGTDERPDFYKLYNLDTNLGKSLDSFQGLLLIGIISCSPLVECVPPTQPIRYRSTLFSNQSERRIKYLEIKFKQFVEFDSRLRRSLDASNSSVLIMDAFNKIFRHLHKKSEESLSSYYRVIEALPVFLSIKALASDLIDPMSRLSMALFSEYRATDGLVLMYRAEIEINAKIVLSDASFGPY